MQNLQIVDNNEILPGSPAFRSDIPVKATPDLKVNYYELDIKRAVDVYQYDLAMHGIKGGRQDRPEKKIELWRQDKNDIAKNQKYHALHELFKILLDENKTFFQTDDDKKPLYVYDRSRTLYSTACLMEDMEERTFCLTLNNLNEQQTLYLRGYSRVEVSLKRTGHLKDIGKLDVDDVSSSRPIMAYLDILLFQQAYATNKYFVFGPKLYLKNEANPKVLQALRNCYDVKSGMTKGCSVLKNIDEYTKRPEKKVYLQIDCKLAAFYRPLPLIEFIWNKFGDPYRCSMREVAKVLKGIAVTTTHRRNKNSTFVIHGLSEEGANRRMFELNGQQTSVADFFAQQYQVLIGEPTFPCVIEKRGSQKNYYPVDVLRIVDGQRVERAKMDPKMNAEMLRACQQKPSQFEESLQLLFETAEISNANPDLKLANVRIAGRRLATTKGIELFPPSLEYRDRRAVDIQDGGWKMDSLKFYEPAQRLNIAVLYWRTGEHEVRRFMDELRYMGTGYGVGFERVDYIGIRSQDGQEELDRLAGADRESFNFVFLISDSKDAHQILKLSEIEKKWPTQQVLLRTLKARRDTMTNILMKLNAKNGGINKVLTSNPQLLNRMGTSVDVIRSMFTNTLLIGIEFCHPPPQSSFDKYRNIEERMPSCVGIASNTNDFQVDHGDYFFVKGRSTVIKSEFLETSFLDSIREYYLKSRRYPSTVVVFRSGISVGEISEVQATEVQILQNAILKLMKASAEFQYPRIIFSSVQKQSNNRIIPAQINPNDRADQQNVRPGTAVLDNISNPFFKEFTIVPHRSLLGTAKPAVVTIVHYSKELDAPDNTGASMSDPEFNNFINLTNSLCYACDAVNSPISAPNPLDAASKVAQRGVNNWKIKYNRMDDDQSSVSSFGINRKFEQAMNEEEKKVHEEQVEFAVNEKLKQWTFELRPKLKTAYWT
ncbi:hypothetical protein FO519_002325 [Halicephalobus sp. NKZ332]|nr:hypothetical protein FO519_002325 [Halicephalobus sp. NKZ332]